MTSRLATGPEFSNVDVPRLLKLLFIDATKKGRHWVAKCPSGLHDDRNPSWSIRDEPGSKRNSQSHCFSCKFGGTPVELVEHVLGLSSSGAADFIAEKAMLEVHPALAVNIEIKSPVRKECTIPERVYFEHFNKWVESAQRYASNREITREQVDQWGIGYAVDGRLGGRIVIPIKDRYGRVLSWVARTFINAEKRYLTASASDNPDKNAIFGEQFWPSEPSTKTLVVTEGAFNALAVQRVSDYSIGALSGSHLEPGHMMKISRFGTVLVCTDPDPAGDGVADKLLYILGRHVQVKRIRLPEGSDCNSLEPEELRSFL